MSRPLAIRSPIARFHCTASVSRVRRPDTQLQHCSTGLCPSCLTRTGLPLPQEHEQTPSTIPASSERQRKSPHSTLSRDHFGLTCRFAAAIHLLYCDFELVQSPLRVGCHRFTDKGQFVVPHACGNKVFAKGPRLAYEGVHGKIPCRGARGDGRVSLSTSTKTGRSQQRGFPKTNCSCFTTRCARIHANIRQPFASCKGTRSTAGCGTAVKAPLLNSTHTSLGRCQGIQADAPCVARLLAVFNSDRGMRLPDSSISACLHQLIRRRSPLIPC